MISSRSIFLALALAVAASATLVPEVSFESLTAESEVIVYGMVGRSWTSWDSERVAIWTHYEIQVSDSLKGSPGRRFVLSEPGGSLDGHNMQIVGAPRYTVGQEVVVFADRTPIGYHRTCGWSQGQFLVKGGAEGGKRLHAASSGAEIVRPERGLEGSPLKVLNGMPLDQALAKIRTQVARGEAE